MLYACNSFPSFIIINNSCACDCEAPDYVAKLNQLAGEINILCFNL